MKGLLIKEFIMFRKTCVVSVMLFILMMLSGIAGEFPLLILASLFMSVLPLSCMSFDETSKWENYSLALPVKRSCVISSKYIFTLMLVSASTILSVILVTIVNEFTYQEYWMLITVLIAAGLIIPAIILPFNFKFGAAKGRIAAMIFAGFIGIITSILSNDEQIYFFNDFTVPVGLIIIVGLLALYLISWRLSVLFYMKREF